MLPRHRVGLLPPGSVLTPSLQAVGRDAELASEVAKYLAGLDPLGKACAAVRRTTQKSPARQLAKKCFLELFAGNAYLVARCWRMVKYV